MVKNKFGQINNKTIKKLDTLLKELNRELSIRVGILPPEGSQRVSGSDLTMAELGAIQEFGVIINVTEKMRNYLTARGVYLKKDTETIILPARSFLREPILGPEGKRELNKVITDYIPDYVADLSDQTIDMLMDKLSFMLAETAYWMVLKAFDHNTIKPPTKQISKQLENSGSQNTLVDTGNLKRSISYEINGKKWGNNG